MFREGWALCPAPSEDQQLVEPLDRDALHADINERDGHCVPSCAWHRRCEVRNVPGQSSPEASSRTDQVARQPFCHPVRDRLAGVRARARAAPTRAPAAPPGARPGRPAPRRPLPRPIAGRTPDPRHGTPRPPGPRPDRGDPSRKRRIRAVAMTPSSSASRSTIPRATASPATAAAKTSGDSSPRRSPGTRPEYSARTTRPRGRQPEVGRHELLEAGSWAAAVARPDCRCLRRHARATFPHPSRRRCRPPHRTGQPGHRERRPRR